MTTNLKQPLLGGIVGTIAMTIVMFIAPLMGMPEMNPAEMLAGMMGFPLIVGWIMHFMIGIIFAMAYATLFIKVVLRLSNNIIRGAIFGLAIFFFSQIIMALMAMMLPMPPMEGSKMLMMVGSIVGHLIFGVVIAQFVKEQE